jgi:hypothetical protein
VEGVAVEERVYEAHEAEEVSEFERFVEDESGVAVVRVMISLLIAIVIGLGVVYPVMKDVINQTNATGTEALILSFISTIFIAGIMYTVISVFF